MFSKKAAQALLSSVAGWAEVSAPQLQESERDEVAAAELSQAICDMMDKYAEDICNASIAVVVAAGARVKLNPDSETYLLDGRITSLADVVGTLCEEQVMKELGS